MAENFPNVMENINVFILKVQWLPNELNSETAKHTHNIVLSFKQKTKRYY
jgi:hypothetical protein